MAVRMTPAQLARLEEISLNLEPGELRVFRSGHPGFSGYELINSDGVHLFYPWPVLGPDADSPAEKEREREVCMQYLFRYKFSQYRPDLTARLLPTHPPEYKTLLGDVSGRYAASFAQFDDGTRGLLTEAFALREGDQVFEGGAYLGFGTVRMGRAVGSTGRILACEAMPENCAVLLANVARNGIRAIPLRRAVSGIDGDGEIYAVSRQSNSIIRGVVPHTGTIPVKFGTIAGICAAHGFTPDFITLTINGAELTAVLGSMDFLSSLKRSRIIAVGHYADEQGCIGPRLEAALKETGHAVFRAASTYYAFKG